MPPALYSRSSHRITHQQEKQPSAFHGPRPSFEQSGQRLVPQLVSRCLLEGVQAEQHDGRPRRSSDATRSACAVPYAFGVAR